MIKKLINNNINNNKNIIKNIGKKAFTLVELIVVIVMMSILGSVGYLSFSNYIVHSKISAIEQDFFAQRNAVIAKFQKPFSYNGLTWSNDTWSATGGYLLGLIPSDITTFSNPSTSTGIIINGKKIKVWEGLTTPVLTISSQGYNICNSVDLGLYFNNQLLYVNELPDGRVVGTYYYRIEDQNICKSKALREKISNNDIRYVIHASGCYLGTPLQSIKLIDIDIN